MSPAVWFLLVCARKRAASNIHTDDARWRALAWQLRRMLEVTVSPSNPVFMLVMKRVGLALRSFVLDRRIAENTKDTGKHPPLPTPTLDELDATAAMRSVHLCNPYNTTQVGWMQSWVECANLL